MKVVTFVLPNHLFWRFTFFLKLKLHLAVEAASQDEDMTFIVEVKKNWLQPNLWVFQAWEYIFMFLANIGHVLV